MGILRNRGFAFSCCFLFLALLAGGEEVVKPMKENCTYDITLETTCTIGAETTNHIAIRFGDANSTDVLVRRLNSKHVTELDPLQPDALDDHPPPKPFQACTVDQFRVTAQCVESPVCYLYLKLAGSDDWRPGFAQVRVVERSHLSSDNFYFRRFLPRHVWHGLDYCDKDVTPFGVKHTRKIYGKKPIH